MLLNERKTRFSRENVGTLFFCVIGNYFVIFLLHKNAPRKCNMSQATALGSSMCYGTCFIYLVIYRRMIYNEYIDCRYISMSIIYIGYLYMSILIFLNKLGQYYSSAPPNPRFRYLPAVSGFELPYHMFPEQTAVPE